jgi:hypothetical protein
MLNLAPPPRRVAASPYAKRLARERDIALFDLIGSGPDGRIVAADVLGYRPKAPAPATLTAASTVGAFAAGISLSAIETLLAGFADAGTPFDFEDVALRAAGCSIDDVPGVAQISDAPVALEGRDRQTVFTGLRRQSLAPLRKRRLETVEDDAAQPASLSLRIVTGNGIRPVGMPLKAGRPMRLVLTVEAGHAEALLSFDSALVADDDAAELLSRFKAYLEKPLRLLA